MKPSDGDQIQCPCCKECKDCNTGFQKVVNLKNAGLVIYRHTTRTEDVNKDTGIIELATKTTEDVFILHNTKDMQITSANFLPEIEQNQINCPRCRRIIEHVQKLLQKVPTMNRNDVKGICEHCRTKEAPCFECKEVVKKFVASKIERAENTKERVKQWLSKIKHLLKDAVADGETGKERVRAHSELHIDQLCRDAPQSGREPDVKQMFHPESNRSDFFGTFPPSIEKRKRMFEHFTQLEKLEHPVVFIDSPGKVGKPSTCRPEGGINVTDRDRVYASDVDSEDLRAMFFSPLSEEERQKEKHRVELRENIPPVPFQSEEDFIVGRDESVTEFGQILNQRTELDKKHYLGSSKAAKGVLRKTDASPIIIRKYHSEEALLTSIAGVTEDIIKQGFNYVFPKILSPDKKLKQQKSSSELIKDTQDMLQTRAEKDKKRLEEERKKKFEEEERKRIAREARKKELEAKKTEQQKGVETKSNTDKKDEKGKQKKDKVTPTTSTATSKSKSKDSRPAPEKKETKAKPKEPKKDKDSLKADKESKHIQKEQDKKDKEERIKKEKEEKEKLKKEKEKQLRLDKEEKEKLKKEKEKQLRLEKEEKEKLKKEKEKQLRIEKEQKEKIKDSKQQQKDELQREKTKSDKQKETPASNPKDLFDEKAEKRAREEAELQMKKDRETEVETKPMDEKPKVPKKIEKPSTKDLNIKSIKVREPSTDDLILQLVKVNRSKGDRIKPKRLSEMNLTAKDVKMHRLYHKQHKSVECFICLDSDVELDVESLDLIKDDDGMANIIVGPKIFKYKPPLIERQDNLNKPLLFQSTYDDTNADVAVKEVATSPRDAKEKSGKQVQGTPAEQGVPKGVIRYALSDRTFIDKGWTMLPTEKVVRKMNVYRMRPAHPEFDWFEHNKNRRLMQYDSGEKLAEFEDNGRGRWFYRNGRMALDYYDAEELNAQQRFVIYSSGEPDERGRAQPYTLLATFDYLGNGIVFDHKGKIRLKYNQTEGVVLDRSIGPVSHWKWHTLNDPPVLQQVMIDTQMAHKDPSILKLGGANDGKTRPDNEDMLAIEFDNFIKEKSKKLSQSFKPFQIKMKALKINEHFSLKVLDQATVYLIFRDGTTNLKLNIGMVLDHKEIVDTDTAELGEVSNNMERLPARTDSLAELQKSIAHAQHYDRARTERELRLRPTVSCGSADRLVSAASRPMRLPLRTGPSGSTTTAADYYCKCSRKPTASNLYYDTRLC